jgi:hypothetical protein
MKENFPLPIDVANNTFKFIYSVVLGTSYWKQQLKESAFDFDRSISDLDSDFETPKISWIFTFIVFLLACTLILLLFIATSYVVLRLIDSNTDGNWVLRNLIFINSVCFSFGCFGAIADNFIGGIKAMIAGAAVATIVYTAISLLLIFNVFVKLRFNSINNQEDISYFCGSLAIGACMALFSPWLQRAHLKRIDLRLHSEVPNISIFRANLNLLVFILSFTSLGLILYYLSQLLPGQDDLKEYSFSRLVTLTLFPLLVATIFRVKLSYKKPNFKKYQNSCIPVIAINAIVCGLFSLLFAIFYESHRRLPDSKDPLYGVGIGLISGAVTLGFLCLMNNAMQYTLPKKVFKVIGLRSSLVVWLIWTTILLLGTFKHFDTTNKYFTLLGLPIGWMLGHLINKITAPKTYSII